MYDINQEMLKFIKEQLSQQFKNLNIIYSSVGVPGEGEHKIMDYIRESYHN